MSEDGGVLPGKDTNSQAAVSSDGRRRPPLREINVEQLRLTLKEHERWAAEFYTKWVHASGDKNRQESYARSRPDLSWLDLQGRDFRKRDLRGADLRNCRLEQAQFADLFGGGGELHLDSGADLSGALLKGADLQGAILRGVNLQHADLTDAILKRADLCFACLTDATLQRVDFTGAALSHVKGLQGAKLEDVILEAVTGLKGTEFARGNLTGARLPHGIADFAILRAVEDTSKNAQTAFVSMLLGCLYSWLTIATTIDARLLTNSASSPLPLVQTEVPIAGFYWTAPIILIASFVWLHLYLQDLWTGLAGLPAIFPDGKPLDQRASPWLLTGLVRPHFDHLKTDRPPLSRIKVGISILLAWWLVPATAVLFWLRYLPRHDWPGTVLHATIVVVATASAIWFQLLAKQTLRGTLAGSVCPDTRPPTSTPRRHRRWRLKDLPLALENAPKQTWRRWGLASSLPLGILVVALVSDGAINGTVKTEEQEVQPWTHRIVVPKLLQHIGARAFAALSEAAVSTRPDGWLLASPTERLELVEGAQLRSADLRHASADGAFLAKADLSYACLEGADLRGANLVGANLQGANLRRAKLSDADLQGANLRGADLQRADLRRATLKRVKFADANLTETDLEGANLEEADLGQAKGLNTQVQFNPASVAANTNIQRALDLVPGQRQCPERPER